MARAPRPLPCRSRVPLTRQNDRDERRCLRSPEVVHRRGLESSSQTLRGSGCGCAWLSGSAPRSYQGHDSDHEKPDRSDPRHKDCEHDHADIKAHVRCCCPRNRVELLLAHLWPKEMPVSGNRTPQSVEQERDDEQRCAVKHDRGPLGVGAVSIAPAMSMVGKGRNATAMSSSRLITISRLFAYCRRRKTPLWASQIPPIVMKLVTYAR